MKLTPRATAKQASIMAISAALYAVLFALSYSVSLPNFTLLYLPIILLGVFPIWFGWRGLVGSMIGAFIAGFFVEGLAFSAWAEAVTTLIIYSLNWLLIPRRVAEAKTKRSVLALSGIYAVTLLAGTSYILWQLYSLGFLTTEIVLAAFPTTYALNLVIGIVVCPALIRTLSPKLKGWGLYAGTFSEWLSKRNAAKGS